MQSRAAEVRVCLDATLRGDWRTLGQYAELDSIRLHGVTMSGSLEQKLFAWEPENITLFRMCNDLRAADVPVYASTDTGPTVVFMTHRDHVARVVSEIRRRCPELDVIEGNVAGPAELVDPAAALREL
jgi:diphosphomevalonate decarboxylase